MEKQKGKEKQQNEGQSKDGETSGSKEVKDTDDDDNNNNNNLGVHKVDEVDCVTTAQGLKAEGNRFFLIREYEEAMLKYEKAIKMLPSGHLEISHIRANMASCYMQSDPPEYSKAIHECDLALNVTPGYSKAFLKRARCYEALNRLDLALRDICTVLEMDPKNPMALEVLEKVKKTLESKGLRVKDSVIELSPDYVEPATTSDMLEVVESKTHMDKKSKRKVKQKNVGQEMETRRTQDKEVIDEKIEDKNIEEVKTAVKLVHAEDIRWAKLPAGCTLFQLRKVIHERFPNLRAVHVKYRDQEGDLVTITTDEELRMAEVCVGTQGSMRFYVVEVSPDQDPFFFEIKKLKLATIAAGKFKAIRKSSSKIEDWMVKFAELFKKKAGVESDGSPNHQELGMKIYSEALEEAVTCEEAQEIFDIAADKFRHMAAQSLLSLGNVHMSRARKIYKIQEIVSRESVLEQIQTAYGCVQKEHTEARDKYDEAATIKPDLFEAFLALGLQQFEEAKLSWYHVLGSHVDLKTWSYSEVLELYQEAQKNINKSMEVLEAKKSSEASQVDKINARSHEKILSQENTVDKATKLKSLVNVIWGTILYERSIMECKLGLPMWQESLKASLKKFEVAGTSSIYTAMLRENYVEKNALRDLIFQTDEIVQACNEICEAKTWGTGIPSDRLEQILNRRISNIFRVSDAVVQCD